MTDKITLYTTKHYQLESTMTEAEWVAWNDDPQKMIEIAEPRTSERKLRLFCCACVRRVWHLLADVRSQASVEASEHYADQQISVNELVARRKTAYEAWLEIAGGNHRSHQAAAAAAAFEVANEEMRLVYNAVNSAACATERKEEERKAQCQLFRDIIGYPFSQSAG